MCTYCCQSNHLKKIKWWTETYTKFSKYVKFYKDYPKYKTKNLYFWFPQEVFYLETEQSDNSLFASIFSNL